MRLVWLAIAPVFCLACSNSTGSGDGGPDAAADTKGDEPDSSSNPNPDAGPCNLPSDCPTNDVCCGTIPITGGTVPNCTTGNISTACSARSACKTSLGTTCSGTQTVRLCSTNTDCTESGDMQCCTFGGTDGGGLSFCANAFIAAFGGGVCM